MRSASVFLFAAHGKDDAKDDDDRHVCDEDSLQQAYEICHPSF